MRWLAGFLLLLAAIGWLACEIRLPAPTTATGASLDSWRLTRDGWEQASWLTPPTSRPAPSLHPAVVGLLELLLSLTALVAFPACLTPTKAPNVDNHRSHRTLHAATHCREQTNPPFRGVSG